MGSSVSLMLSISRISRTGSVFFPLEAARAWIRIFPSISFGSASTRSRSLSLISPPSFSWSRAA